MRTQGRKLSRQAREKLNSVLLDWFNENKEQIDDCCLLAELFGKTRWREAPLERLRAQMRKLLVNLRVTSKSPPGICTILPLEEVREQFDAKGGGWQRLSTTVKAATFGADHSTIIKSEKAKALQKESKR